MYSMSDDSYKTLLSMITMDCEFLNIFFYHLQKPTSTYPENILILLFKSIFYKTSNCCVETENFL